MGNKILFITAIIILSVSGTGCSRTMRTDATENRGSYTCHHISYKAPDGDRVPAYLLIPHGIEKDRPRPGLVLLHDHGARFDIGKEKLVRPMQDAPEHIKRSSLQWVKKNFDGIWFADSLAALGYVVIVPDMLYWGERSSRECQKWSYMTFCGKEAGKKEIKQLKSTIYEGQKAIYDSLMAEGTVWAEKTLAEDASAIGILKETDCVDSEKIGVFGWSMGAHRAWLLAGFCDDVKAGVSVGWMTLKKTQEPPYKASDYSMLIPSLRDKYDFPDIARKLAPRPYCFLSGDKDRLFPKDTVAEAFKLMEEIYGEAGAGAALSTGFYPGPHHCGKEVQAMVVDFLENSLNLP